MITRHCGLFKLVARQFACHVITLVTCLEGCKKCHSLPIDMSKWQDSDPDSHEVCLFYSNIPIFLEVYNMACRPSDILICFLSLMLKNKTLSQSYLFLCPAKLAWSPESMFTMVCLCSADTVLLFFLSRDRNLAGRFGMGV